jgi:arginase
LDVAVPGLLYVDRQFDLNTPESTTDGALDWMGLAHGLSLPGCVDALADAFGRRPLLQRNQVAWLGVEASLATEWERQQVARLGLHVSSSQSLASDPAGATDTALRVLPPGPLAVHVDVDVLDFTDAPLAENTDGRNTGPTLGQLGEALGRAVRDPRLRAFSIGELNPTRAAGDPGAIHGFVHTLAATLGATPDPNRAGHGADPEA